jgi:hypothetical protein
MRDIIHGFPQDDLGVAGHLEIPRTVAAVDDRQAPYLDVVFGSDRSCISPPDLAANTLGQPRLWSYGLSGDVPIVLVRVS